MKQKTSIIILTYNHLDETKECLKSIRKYTKKETYEIIIVDNFSTDGTRDWLKKQNDLKVIYNDENLGFPKGCNQAIKKANKKNDILLLNNDTIVTSNWLDNLKKCLYSDVNIGAVGAVCNHHENLQGVDFTYDNLEDMQLLAKKNNISDPNRWEEKIFLIGFCMLIKRKVMNKIRKLDENYSPGYIEDNDLSLRIIKLGYHLMLCHDSFIHHYLGSSFRSDLDTFYTILNKNREYFISKWGFHPFAFDELKNNSFYLLNDQMKILDINCGIGVNILKLKYQNKNRIVHGIESSPSKRKIAKKIAPVFTKLSEVKDYDYDCIMIGNLLEHTNNPKILIQNLKKHLKKGGIVIGEIHNILDIDHIKGLLEGNWYNNYKDHKLTIHDVNNLFINESYQKPLYYILEKH